jgi:ribosomal-protein-alanine N-acetyltransferase
MIRTASSVHPQPRTAPQRLGPLGLEHLSACQALDAAVLGGLWSAAQWQTELAEEGRPGIGLWEGEALLAMACGWLIVDELHITLVAVDPGHRRQGLGRRVLQGLISTARQRGAHYATLEVSTANTAARGLYGAAGFQEAGVRRGYYRNGEDALIQWLRLNG